jgi:Flp pilus assembly protein TadD
VQGKHVEAIDDYSKVLALTPKNADAYFWRGVAHQRRGDRDQAVRDYEKALKVAPATWTSREKAEEALKLLQD